MNQTRLDDLDLEFHKEYKIYLEISLVKSGRKKALLLMLFGVIIGMVGSAQSAFAILIDFDPVFVSGGK